MKKIRIIIATCLICALGAGTAFAGTAYSNYSTTVGRLNGSGYTSYQRKAISGANGNLNSRLVGGNYVVDARMQEKNGASGAWTRNITDNTFYELDSHVNHSKGDSVRVHFSNDWNTPVNVQVAGSWRSN